MATVGSLVVKIGTDISGLQAGLNTAQSRLRAFGANLKSVGTGLTLGMTAPIAGIATAALRSASGFEESMNLIQTMSGATGGDIQALQAQALELGRVTVFSAGDAAGAMLELSKAGLTVSQTSAAIPGVLDLAAAGGLDLADAATITANAINAFGLEASSSAAVANTFAAAANASSADVGTLAEGFANAGAVFSANGQSVNDLAAALSIMSNNGIAGAEAGTGLKVMMQRLAAPTAGARKAMNELGLSIYDSTGQMRPFGDIVGQMESGLAGLSDAQRNAAMQVIFGTHAMIPANILVAEGAAGYEQMLDAVSRQGAASEVAAARMQGLGGAVKYFKGSIDSMLIATALPFMATLAGMVRNAADLLTRFTTLSPAVQRFAAVLVAVLAVVGPLLVMLGVMATGLAALMSPVGLVIAGLVLLGAAVAANWGAISRIVSRGAKAVQPALDSIIATVNGLRSGDLTFRDVGAGLLAELQTLPAKVQGWAASVDWAGLVGQAGDVGAAIYAKVAGWFASIDWAGMLTTTGNAASSLTSAVGSWLAGIDWVGGAASVQGGLTSLRDAVLSRLASIDWAGGAAGIQDGLTRLRDAVTSKLAAVDWAGGAASIEGGIAHLRDSIVATVGSIDWACGISKAGSLLSGLDAWRDGLMSQVTSRIATFDWSAAGSTFSGWVEGLSTAVKGMDLTGIDWSGFLSGKLLGPFSAALSALKFVMGDDAFGALKSSVTTGIAAIDWAGVADSMFGLASAVGGQLFTMGIDLVDDVSTLINDIDWGTLSVDFAGMVSWVATKIGEINWAEAGFDIGNALLNLAGAVGGAIGTIDWGALFKSGTELLGSTGKAGLDIGGGLLTAVSEKINAVDWAAASVDFSAMVTELTTKVQETDWSEMGVNLGTRLRTMFENTFSSEGDNPLSSLALAVRTAFTSIQWGDIGASLTGFADAAKTAVGGFVTGVMTGLGVDMTALQWPAFPAWEWPAYLSWEWPAYLTWVWPDWPSLPEWHWPDWPDWHWPSLPAWHWPAIPVPGWLSWLTGGGGNNAVGTPNWPGGLTTVGEFGPELVRLPAGSRIYSHQASMALTRANGQTVNVGPVYVSDKVDVEALAYRVATINARRGR